MALIEVEGSLISASAVSPSQGISERDERERERERCRQADRETTRGWMFLCPRSRKEGEREKKN